MKTYAFLLALTLPFTSCGDSAGAASTHEGLVEQMTTSVDGMLDAISNATDEASREAAHAKIHEIEEQMAGYVKAFQDLGDPDSETRAKLEAQMQAAMDKMQAKVTELGSKVLTDPKLGELLKEMGEITKTLPLAK